MIIVFGGVLWFILAISLAWVVWREDRLARFLRKAFSELLEVTVGVCGVMALAAIFLGGIFLAGIVFMSMLYFLVWVLGV